MSDLVDVMLCCRDDRGNLSGRLVAVDFGDDAARLSGYVLADEGDQPRLEFGRFDDPEPFLAFVGADDRQREAIRVSDPLGNDAGVFFYREHQTWVGNILWDLVRMELPQARALMVHLLRLGFDVEEHALEGPFADLTEGR